MFEGILAVAGTLLGSIVTGLLAHRASRSDRADARDDARRRDQIDVMANLATAVSDHRRAMWEVTDAILTDAPADRIRDLRDESHRTRSAVTEPAVRVRLLYTDQAVRDAADRAIKATYVMRDATTIDQLQDMRAAALEAHDHMVTTAAHQLAA